MIQVKHLPDDSNTHISLYCTKCHGTYSAYAGDYFTYTADHTLKCCRRNLRSVVRRTVLEEIQL
jgi:hypothetical protein